MRISLDLHSTTPAVVGARAGVPPHRLQALTGALVDLLGRLDEAEAAGLLPHLDMCRRPEEMARWVTHGASWRAQPGGAHDRLVLLGEPGAVAAARLLVPIGAAASVRAVDRPDPAQVEAAFAGSSHPRMIVLAGPAWVWSLASLVRRGAPQRTAARGDEVPVTVFDGEGGGAPAGGERAPGDEAVECFDAPGAADPRFGFCLPAALAVAGFCGVSGEALAQAGRAGRAICTDAAVRANPAARLGALAGHLSVIEGLLRPLLLSPTAALDGWARWAAGAWAAVSSRHVPVAGGESPRGAVPLTGRLGDEAVIQRAIAGPRDLWALSVEPRPSRANDPIGRLQARMARVAREQLVEDGRPVARIEVAGDGPAELLTLALVWVQAALIAAALDPVDPLTMDAADRWRDRLDSALE